MTQAILLVGHGTRNPTGQQQFQRLAEHLRAVVAPLPLEFAYIELQTPTIEEALLRLHSQGLKKIALSPALLFAAGHAKQDIPEAVTRAKQTAPDLEITYAEPLGCHPALIELAALRFGTHLAPRDERSWRSASDATSSVECATPALKLPAATLSLAADISRSEMNTKTALVLIGRGSSDSTAIAHCEEFATKLAARLGIEQHFTGFIAIAKPSLPEVLEQAAISGAKQIVVQPHLLFSGEMLDTTAAAVATMKVNHPHIDWRQSDSLGSDLLNSGSISAGYLVKGLRGRLLSVFPLLP